MLSTGYEPTEKKVRRKNKKDTSIADTIQVATAKYIEYLNECNVDAHVLKKIKVFFADIGLMTNPKPGQKIKVVHGRRQGRLGTVMDVGRFSVGSGYITRTIKGVKIEDEDGYNFVVEHGDYEFI